VENRPSGRAFLCIKFKQVHTRKTPAANYNKSTNLIKSDSLVRFNFPRFTI
jgi:hypothetical protein